MEIDSIISDIVGAEVENVVYFLHNKNPEIIGKFFHQGKIYDYSINNDTLSFFENREDSSYINGYIASSAYYLSGLKLDSSNNAYPYLVSMMERLDGDKCKTGIPCGGTCLPPGKKCRFGDRVRHRLLNVRESLSNARTFTSEQDTKMLEKNRAENWQKMRMRSATSSPLDYEGGAVGAAKAGAINAIGAMANDKILEKSLAREERRRERLAQNREKLKAKRQALIDRQ